MELLDRTVILLLICRGSFSLFHLFPPTASECFPPLRPHQRLLSTLLTVTPAGLRPCLTVVSSEHQFMYFFGHAKVFFRKMSIYFRCPFFKNLSVCFVIELYEFFIYFEHRSLIHYIVCKYCLPFCGLPSPSLRVTFSGGVILFFCVWSYGFPNTICGRRLFPHSVLVTRLSDISVQVCFGAPLAAPSAHLPALVPGQCGSNS